MSLLDITLRQSLLVERIKRGRIAALAQLKFEVSTALRKSLDGLPDDAFTRMGKGAYLRFVAGINADLSSIFVGHSEATLEWLGDYIEFDGMVAAILYSSELRRAVKIPDKDKVFSTFANTILPPRGLTPAQTLAGLTAYSVGQLAGRVRLAQTNLEEPHATLQALLGNDALRNVGSILARVMMAVSSVDVTLVQAAHIQTNYAVMAAA